MAKKATSSSTGAAKGKKKASAKAAAKSKAPDKSSASEIPVKTFGAKAPAAGKLLAPLEDIEKMFDDLLQRRWPALGRWEWPKWPELSEMLERRAPSVDIVDRDKEIVVRAEVPGIDKKDLDVSIADRMLTIKGSSRSEQKDERDDYFRHEIKSGTFSRSVLLPAEIEASKAKASFKDGVLELNLPKAQPTIRKKIAVG